jgi:hypothetical protein
MGTGERTGPLSRPAPRPIHASAPLQQRRKQRRPTRCQRAPAGLGPSGGPSRSLPVRLGITDFLVCETCGVYVAPTMQASMAMTRAVTVNILDERKPFLRKAAPVSYFREDVEQRMARRLLTWMPVEQRE